MTGLFCTMMFAVVSSRDRAGVPVQGVLRGGPADHTGLAQGVAIAVNQIPPAVVVWIGVHRDIGNMTRIVRRYAEPGLP